jgi:foldase protein PrsA
MTKSNNGRIWMIVAVILAILLIVYAIIYPPGKSAKSDTVTLASVNGVNISKDDLYNALVASGGQQTMDTLINNELVRQAVEKKGLKITDADVQKEMDSVRSSFGSDEEFQQTLAQYGMTVEGLKQEMTTQASMRKLLEPQVKVTDADIKKYYDDNLADLKTPEQVTAAHILVATEAEANTILADLKNGADFAAKAKEKSTDTSTKDNGGLLQPFAKGDNEEAIDSAVFPLKVGELSGVVKATDGYHIYKVTAHTAEVTPTLAEKTAEIRETLTTQQISDLSQTWMQEQQASAKIVNSLAAAQ